MRVVKTVNVTPIAAACPKCGAMIDDRELLEEAQYMRWTCPACGAMNQSYNSMLASATVTESGNDLDDEPEEEEYESCTTIHTTPEEIEKMRQEFLKKTTL